MTSIFFSEFNINKDFCEDYSNGNCFGLVVAFSQPFSRMATQRNYYKNSLQAYLSLMIMALSIIMGCTFIKQSLEIQNISEYQDSNESRNNHGEERFIQTQFHLTNSLV